MNSEANNPFDRLSFVYKNDFIESVFMPLNNRMIVTVKSNQVETNFFWTGCNSEIVAIDKGGCTSKRAIFLDIWYFIHQFQFYVTRIWLGTDFVQIVFRGAEWN